jgi:hypothetical protein
MSISGIAASNPARGMEVYLWDWRFESRPGSGCLSLVSVVCCRVEFSAASWSFFQNSSTDCGASLWVTQKPQEWGRYGPRFFKRFFNLFSPTCYITISRYIDQEHCSMFYKYNHLLWPTKRNTYVRYPQYSEVWNHSTATFSIIVAAWRLYIYIYIYIYMGADKSLARPTSRCILFDD